MYEQKMIRSTITLPLELDALLLELGQGNRSAGIRALWEARPAVGLLASLRRWLIERRDQGHLDARGEDTEEAAQFHEGIAYAYDDVLDWLDARAADEPSP